MSISNTNASFLEWARCMAQKLPAAPMKRTVVDAEAAEIARNYDALAARLAHIAAIAHDGGLWSADDHKLWVAVRQLTLPYWQNGGDFNERRRRIADAMNAADCGDLNP